MSKKPLVKQTIQKKIVNVVAINVSPIHIDSTPEQVHKRSQVDPVGVQRHKRCKDVVGISDFNVSYLLTNFQPMDLIESTDTSNGQRDSIHNRGSRSCIPSPTKDTDLQFRKEVDKYLNGYSVVLSNHFSEDEQQKSDQHLKSKGCDRYSEQEENEIENGYQYERIGDSQSEYLKKDEVKSQRKQIKENKTSARKSKSFSKENILTHKLVGKIPKVSLNPSGPTYNVEMGGKVQAKKLAQTPQNTNLTKTNIGFPRSNSVFKFNKLESTYSQTNRKRAIAIHQKLQSCGTNSEFNLNRPASSHSNKQVSMIVTGKQCLTSQGTSETSSKIHSNKNSLKCHKKALTTGHYTSEGTDTSCLQSPRNPVIYQDFAQTAYNFEIQNAMKGTQAKKSLNHMNDTQIANMEQIFPQIKVKINSKYLYAQNHIKPPYPQARKGKLTNHTSKANLIIQENRIGSKKLDQIQMSKMASNINGGNNKKKYLENQCQNIQLDHSKRSLKSKFKTPRGLKKEIEILKQRISNANLIVPINRQQQQLLGDLMSPTVKGIK